VEIRYAELSGSSDPQLVIEHSATNNAPTEPTSLQAEGVTNPTNVIDPTPEFSAIYTDPNAGDNALYYQIQVATSTSAWTNPVWDSTKTAMAQTAEGTRSPNLVYTGTPLSLDGTTYYWHIKFWDTEDNEGAWRIDDAGRESFRYVGDRAVLNFNGAKELVTGWLTK